jgi:hypothetical protein
MDDERDNWKSLGEVLDELERQRDAELAKRGLRRATREEVAALITELDYKYGFVVPVSDYAQPNYAAQIGTTAPRREPTTPSKKRG